MMWSMEPSLLQAVLDELDSHEPKLILADWLEENGGPVLAYAYRWAASRKLRPYRSPAGRSVWWGRRPKRGRIVGGAPWANCLPGPIFDSLPRTKGCFEDGRRFVSRGVPMAFEALAEALELLRKTIAL